MRTVHDSSQSLIIEVEPHEEYDQILAPREDIYLGADGALSVEIAPGVAFWMFGDTLIGHLQEGRRAISSMPRNTIAIQDFRRGLPGRFDWVFGRDSAGKLAFFGTDPTDENTWFWPGTAVSFEGSLYLFGYLVGPANGDGPEAMDFTVLDPWLFVIANPLDEPKHWRCTQHKLDFGRTGVWFCTAHLFVDDYVYLYGHRKSEHEDYNQAKSCLARIRTEDLRRGNFEGTFEYLASDRTWSESSHSLAEMWYPAITEASVIYHEGTQRYLATTYFPADPHLRIATAQRPEGPWSDAGVVWTDSHHEANPEFYSYTFRLHPHLFESNALVATYVVNTPRLETLYDHPEYYYPRFLRIRIEHKFISS